MHVDDLKKANFLLEKLKDKQRIIALLDKFPMIVYAGAADLRLDTELINALKEKITRSLSKDIASLEEQIDKM